MGPSYGAPQAPTGYQGPTNPSGGPFQPVSMQPGYQAPTAPPSTISPGMMSAIGGLFSGLGSDVHNAMGGLGNMFNSNTVSAAGPANSGNFNQQMQAKGWTMQPNGTWFQGPGNTPAPSTTPQIIQHAAGIVPSPTGFQFQMGQQDYSWVKPQLQQMLGNSPMAPYLDNFIQAGQKYGVDPRILPLIANNESSLGKNYPTQTFNPFGYTVGGVGPQALANAGFTSLPMAIDHLTARFSKTPYNQPPASYQTFRQNPTIPNLQMAYNANVGDPNEQGNWLNNSAAVLPIFQNPQQ